MAYGAEIPTSVLPTPETARKPAKRNVHKDEVSDFSTFEKHERRVTFYKMGRSALDIPEVSETITDDEFKHVKLFKKSTTIPLPEWHRRGQCVLKMLENFPPYMTNLVDVGNNLTDVD